MEEKKFMGIYITIHNEREAYLYRRLSQIEMMLDVLGILRTWKV